MLHVYRRLQSSPYELAFEMKIGKFISFGILQTGMGSNGDSTRPRMDGPALSMRNFRNTKIAYCFPQRFVRIKFLKSNGGDFEGQLFHCQQFLDVYSGIEN